VNPFFITNDDFEKLYKTLFRLWRWPQYHLGSLLRCLKKNEQLILPLNLRTINEPTCNVAKKINNGESTTVITKYLILDECTMANKRLYGYSIKRWKISTIINKQSLEVRWFYWPAVFAKRCQSFLEPTVADEINACSKSSNLWSYVEKTLMFTTNIRITLQND